MKVRHILFLLTFSYLFFSCKDAPAPVIESVDPAFGPAETLVVFKGSNLNDLETLSFSGQEVNFNNAYNSDNALLFRVPTNIPLGDHEVVFTTSGGSSSTNFRVTLEAPEVFNVSPEFASSGDIVTITGKNFFDPVTVYFHDSIMADIIYLAPDSMEVVVPQGIEKGRIVVWANGGRALSPTNFFSVNSILVSDFDGNGLRSETTDWKLDNLIDQANMTEAVQNSSPDPISGNFLKLSGKDDLDISWVGGAENVSENVMDFNNFGITATAANTLLEMDINNNGKKKTKLILILLERDGSSNDFTQTIDVDWDGWEKISIPINRFEDFNGFIIDPLKIKKIKMHLTDDDDSNPPLEVNIDNIEFIEIL